MTDRMLGIDAVALRDRLAGAKPPRVLAGGMLAWTAAGAPLTRAEATWGLERQVRLVAGGIAFVAVLGSLVVPGLQWLAAAIGAALAMAALTDTCAMGALLAKLPHNRGPRQDMATIMAQLAAGGRAPTGTERMP